MPCPRCGAQLRHGDDVERIRELEAEASSADIRAEEWKARAEKAEAELLEAREWIAHVKEWVAQGDANWKLRLAEETARVAELTEERDYLQGIVKSSNLRGHALEEREEC